MENLKDKICFKLIIPAEEKWQTIGRMTLSAAGAILGMSIDQVDDLRMMADEAYECMINQPQKPDSIEMSCYEQEGFAHVAFAAKGGSCDKEMPQEYEDIEIVKAILDSLCTQSCIKQDGPNKGICEIRVKLPLNKL